MGLRVGWLSIVAAGILLGAVEARSQCGCGVDKATTCPTVTCRCGSGVEQSKPLLNGQGCCATDPAELCPATCAELGGWNRPAAVEKVAEAVPASN